MVQLAGSSNAIEHITYEQAYGQSFDDMARRVPNLSRVRGVILLSANFNLDQIIRSVIQDKQNELEKTPAPKKS